MSTAQLPAADLPDADGEFYEHEVFLGVDGRLYGMHRLSDPDAGEWQEDEEIRAHFTNDGLFIPPIDVQGGARYEGGSLHDGNVTFYAVHPDVTPPVADGRVHPLVGAMYTLAPGSRVRRSKRQQRAGRRRRARSPGGSDDPEPHLTAVTGRWTTCYEGVRS
jgi:hypothetical protein